MLETPSRQRSLPYYYFEGVDPIRLRISSLILRFSLSSLAIIHWSFSLKTAASKLSFSFCTVLVALGAKDGIKNLPLNRWI